MRFYGLIVLFNPDTDLFVQNIKTLLQSGVDVIIYDNSTSPEVVKKNYELVKNESEDNIFSTTEVLIEVYHMHSTTLYQK